MRPVTSVGSHICPDLVDLREFVNCRHSGPRRVWKGRGDQQSLPRIRGIRGIRGCVPFGSDLLYIYIYICAKLTSCYPQFGPTIEKPKENRCFRPRTLKNLRKIDISGPRPRTCQDWEDLGGFGVKIDLKVTKTIKIDTFLLGIVVFPGKKPPEAAWVGTLILAPTPGSPF